MNDPVRFGFEMERLLDFCEAHACELELRPSRWLVVRQHAVTWRQPGPAPEFYFYRYDFAGLALTIDALRQINDELIAGFDRHVRRPFETFEASRG
jgi:hypothetical protein